MAVMPQCPSPMSRWKQFATTLIGLPPNWPVSAASTPATRARYGIRVCCQSTPWTDWPPSAVVMWRLTAAAGWIGTPCAKKLRSMACAIPTVSPSHPLRPSPTSLVWMRPSNPALATFQSSPICRVNSPSSMATWCATSSDWGCGMT